MRLDASRKRSVLDMLYSGNLFIMGLKCLIYLFSVAEVVVFLRNIYLKSMANFLESHQLISFIKNQKAKVSLFLTVFNISPVITKALIDSELAVRIPITNMPPGKITSFLLTKLAHRALKISQTRSAKT